MTTDRDEAGEPLAALPEGCVVREAGRQDARLLAQLGERAFREAWHEYNTPGDMDAYCAAHFNLGATLADLDRPGADLRLTAGNNPTALALSPDGKVLLVANELSRITRFPNPPVTEVTALDPVRGRVTARPCGDPKPPPTERQNRSRAAMGAC